jgi:hypothetical protein
MKTPLVLFLASSVLAGPALAQQLSGNESAGQSDYRSRTVYFMADRFHLHEPWYHPYVDPEHPFATNDVNCFAESCTEEQQFRRYWGGDIQGIIQKHGGVGDAKSLRFANRYSVFGTNILDFQRSYALNQFIGATMRMLLKS